MCDYTVKIPMSHGVDSLNVAAASAVAFWQLGASLMIHKEAIKIETGEIVPRFFYSIENKSSIPNKSSLPSRCSIVVLL